MPNRFIHFDVEDEAIYPVEDFDSKEEWSCTSIDGSDDDDTMRRKNRWPIFNTNTKRI